jgi:hypothetical protein
VLPRPVGQRATNREVWGGCGIGASCVPRSTAAVVNMACRGVGCQMSYSFWTLFTIFVSVGGAGSPCSAANVAGQLRSCASSQVQDKLNSRRVGKLCTALVLSHSAHCVRGGCIQALRTRQALVVTGAPESTVSVGHPPLLYVLLTSCSAQFAEILSCSQASVPRHGRGWFGTACN